MMAKYQYTVNTFMTANGLEPLQLSGTVEADSVDDVINKLVSEGIVYERGFEFLDIHHVEHDEFIQKIRSNQ